MAELRVALVSPEREVWSGEAEFVVARTLEGEIGILPGHSPVLGVLLDGSIVKITPTGGADPILAMVGSGFLSVANDEVSVLAEQAELGTEIDVSAAREALRQAGEGERDEQAAAAERRARARLQAAGVEE
ncbi:MAG TPA: F0F1 ATP synthase subunit epsilon [Streptosporangiaceae bacterium]|nr:F0F1 ATP synthase subunit epsilon [Streptosporangiaceae bacterium]